MAEYRNRKLIQFKDIACPSDQNITEYVKKKLQKYQQLAYKIGQRRPDVAIISVVIGYIGEGAVSGKS